jgi:fructan beta-fructosidase
LESLRGNPRQKSAADLTGSTGLWRLDFDTLEMLADLEPSQDASFLIKLQAGETEETVLRVDLPGHTLTLDRTRSGKVDFHNQFPGTASAAVRLVDGRLKLRLFVDTSSIEVFANDGETVLTSIILPSPGERRLELQVVHGTLRQANLAAWKLTSAWSAGE